MMEKIYYPWPVSELVDPSARFYLLTNLPSVILHTREMTMCLSEMSS